MQLKIHQSPEITETQITIQCGHITPQLKEIIDSIRRLDYAVSGRKEGAWYRIPVDEILYIDTVDNRTFVYSSSECYEVREKLYELEEKLKRMSFVRINKNTLVNIRALKCTRAVEFSRMEVTMQNGERLIVTRHYLNDFKAAFGIGGDIK